MPLPKMLRRLFGKQETPAATAVAAPVRGYDLLFGGSQPPQADMPSTLPTVVIIGNCFAEEIERGLLGIPEAKRRFQIYGVPLHLKPLNSPEAQRVIASASHVFVQNFASADLNAIRGLVPKGCEITLYPDVVLKSLWPFDDYNGFRDPVLDAKENCEFHNHDGALATLRQTIPDKDKRFEAYRDLQFDGAKRIDIAIEAQARYLAQIDQNSDAYLGRFITRHFKDTQLFYNSAHPNGMVFKELVDYCLRKLGLPGDLKTRANLDGWRQWSVPVHPAIAARLNLSWASEYTKYQYGDLGKVTWEQWVRAYIDTLG